MHGCKDNGLWNEGVVMEQGGWEAERWYGVAGHTQVMGYVSEQTHVREGRRMGWVE